MSGHGQGSVQAQGDEGRNAKVGKQRFPGVLALVRGGGVIPAHDGRAGLGRFRAVGDDFAGIQGVQGRFQGGGGVFHLLHVKFPGGHVAGRHAAALAVHAHGAKEIVPLFPDDGGIGQCARRDDTDDVPVHQALGKRRVLHLFPDGYPIAPFHQPGHIGIHGVVGHAAHGGALLQAAVLARQGQLQFPAGGEGVLKEHFVKIAHPEKQQGVRVLFFQAHVLLHHGGEGSHRLTLLPSRSVKTADAVLTGFHQFPVKWHFRHLRFRKRSFYGRKSIAEATFGCSSATYTPPPAE